MTKRRTLPADALAALQTAVARAKSQAKVAGELGLSATVVNQCLKGKYAGDVDGVAQRIRGQYLQERVHCPVLGELSSKDCLVEQRRPLVFTNPARVALHRACKTCPHRRDAAAQPDGGTRHA